MIFSIVAPLGCSMPWSRGAHRHGVLHRRTFRHGFYVTASLLEWQMPAWPNWNCPYTMVHAGWCTRVIHPRCSIRDDPPRKGQSGNTSHLRRSIRNAPCRMIHLGGSIRDRTPGIRMANPEANTRRGRSLMELAGHGPGRERSKIRRQGTFREDTSGRDTQVGPQGERRSRGDQPPSMGLSCGGF